MNPGEEPSLYSLQFPALLPIVSKIDAAEVTNARISALEKGFHAHQKELNDHVKLLFNFMERNMVVAADEILKWSVLKRGEVDGDGGQLFKNDRITKNMVLRGCVAIGMPCHHARLHEYKEMSRTVIKARNNTAHSGDLQALDSVVRNCIEALRIWPELEENPSLKNQARVIRHYDDYKRMLPECFK